MNRQNILSSRSGSLYSFWLEIRFMLILGTICGIFLTFTHGRVGSRADFGIEGIKAVFNIIGQQPEIGKEVESFDNSFKKLNSGKIQVWNNIKNDSLWVCQVRGAGMWAEITLMFVFNSAYESIVGMRILHQAETAGLGDRITEPEFYQQFEQLKAIEGTIEMVSIRIDNNQFDAISGATISSRAVEALINRGLKAIKRLALLPADSAQRKDMQP